MSISLEEENITVIENKITKNLEVLYRTKSLLDVSKQIAL